MNFHLKEVENFVAEHYEREFDMNSHSKVAPNLVTEYYESDLDVIFYFNPFSHSGHCIGQPFKISTSLQEGIIKKISYERCAYESVDDKSLSGLYPKKLWKMEFVTERMKVTKPWLDSTVKDFGMILFIL